MLTSNLKKLTFSYIMIYLVYFSIYYVFKLNSINSVSINILHIALTFSKTDKSSVCNLDL